MVVHGSLLQTNEQREEFLRVVATTNAEVRYGGSKAVYYRDADYIQMPEEGRFESFQAFAETLAHELAHWSEKRLEWTGSYSEGELRAELAAVFTMSSLNFDVSQNLTNHAAYIRSWLKALQDDPKYFFRASAAASKASDFILSFSRPQDESEVESESEAVAA